MAKIYRNKAGKKLYPVCKWEDNQHKIYNAHDRIMIRIYEAQENGGVIWRLCIRSRSV